MLRSTRLDPVLIQALIAGALSFAHLHDLAEAAGQTGWKAWAYPVSVDLLFVAAWRRMRVLRARGDSARTAWVWFIIALAASLGANVATAGLLDMNHIPAVLRIIVAGWPALAFLGGTLLAHTPTPTADAPAPSPDPAPSDPEPAADITVDRAPEPAPALPAPPPAPEPKAPALQVPPALVEHARKVADTHRATTGSPIDTDTLRARLGVPAPLADAIATHLK